MMDCINGFEDLIITFAAKNLGTKVKNNFGRNVVCQLVVLKEAAVPGNYK